VIVNVQIRGWAAIAANFVYGAINTGLRGTNTDGAVIFGCEPNGKWAVAID